MNWNKDKSVLLSRICVLFFALVLCAMGICAPWLFRAYIQLRGTTAGGTLNAYLTTAYTSAVFEAVALYQLHRLLQNISCGQVFEAVNVHYLRVLSWCCLGAGLIFAGSGFYNGVFWALAVMSVFISLILRVVKNVFAEAAEIKQENDYTV